MALTLASGGAGNPGYSLASPTFNAQTGGYNPSVGPVWVGGAGSDPRGPGQESLQQFYNWYAPGMNYQVGANPQITDATAPGYNPNPGRTVTLGGAPATGGAMQPSVMPGGTALGGTGAQPGMAVPGMAGATARAGGTGMQQAIMNNPAALEQYWQQNPQALRQAIGQNPGMFAPTGLQRDSNTAPPTGLIGSEQAQYGGLLAGMGQLNDGMAGAEAAYDKYGQQATDTMDAYYKPGVGANDRQAALSGALGPEAQQAAYAQFMESPGQAYLKEQSEKALTRNAAATGGLQGGNVLQELQRNAIGLAAQDFDASYNRLGPVADRGLSAGNTITGIQSGIGDRLGDMAFRKGQIGADMAFGTGQSLAGGRTRAGELLAGNYSSTADQLAKIQQQFGGQLSDVTGAGAGNLSQILAGAGQNQNQAYQQLAALLANITTGSGTQIGALPGLPGVQQQPGILGDLGKLLEGGAAAYALSDARLKRNTRRIGVTRRGQPLYSWEWNAEGRKLAGSQPTVGVMAHESPPDAVFVDAASGYNMVDYARVL